MLCRRVFFSPSDDLVKKPCIGIHCVAGLGRAPVLASIGLMDAGMTAIGAIELIRNKRKGALNTAQV